MVGVGGDQAHRYSERAPLRSSAGGLEDPPGGREAGASEGRGCEVTSEKQAAGAEEVV